MAVMDKTICYWKPRLKNLLLAFVIGILAGLLCDNIVRAAPDAGRLETTSELNLPG
jgi:hypothetical protein